MKKKLIFISEALWIGGIETALVNLLNHLDYEKYDVTCLVVRGELDMAERIPPQCRLLVVDRYKTVSFGEPYVHSRLFSLTEKPATERKLRLLLWKMIRFFFRGPENRLYAAYIKRQLAGERFDTAVIYSDRTAELAVRAVCAGKFLMFYHHGAMRKEYHDRLGYKRADRVVAVSEAISEKLRKFRPQYADKIIAIHNLTDTESIRQRSMEDADIHYPEDTLNLVSCGRLAVEKGMDLAIDAADLLVHRGYTDFHWWVVGGGPEENALRLRTEKLGLEPYITFLGMQNNPYPYVKKGNLFIQSSRIEAFGLTIMEALSLGIPVLSTSTDGGREILTNGKAGILCEINPEAIADEIQQLMEHPEELQALAREASAIDFEAQNDAIMEQLYGIL